MRLARRMLQIKESGTLKAMSKAKELQAKGIKVIQLDVGEPDFPTPINIIKSAEKAMENGFTHYTPSAGILELREAIANKLRGENGLNVNKDNIIVTPGSKQAIFYAIMALIDEGDEVIIPTPAWPSYMEIVSLAGGRVREIPSYFKLNIEGIKEAINDRTKLIIINSPNNPTGYVMNRNEIKALAEIAMDSKIFVLSDEIYEKLIYEGEHISIGSIPGMEEITLTVNGFSKTYAMTGWRLGYIAAPKPIASAINKLQQHSASCAASFVQMAGIEALNPNTPVKPMIEEFKRRRDYICSALEKLSWFKIHKPNGAFYIFPDISSSGMNSDEFCDMLLEKLAISTTPGSIFGGYNKNIRISYANSMENLKEAVLRIEKLIG
ncbi:MAG: pyridoxal phosphate-dependent aminotransferase [Candidatus Methanomethyliaceae archaeon]|nr:pyridoxal phosphate-dependent aminotransferase [Candidatus Methanomethyliaceae archaeon]MDW7970751.1 pyridoxal phosphate-dependent aminotransferase [Nitrososphaerota archaeon]